MKNKLILGAALLLAAITEGLACTNLIVGKGASADGSVIVSYSADSYGMFGELYHYPAGILFWWTRGTGGFYRNYGLWKSDLCSSPAFSYSQRSHTGNDGFSKRIRLL